MMDVPNITLSNGIQMPQLGLGVWQASDAEAEFAVATAINAGYRLIDTAAMYGNEAGVGRAVAKSDIPREELFVTTKVWNSDQGYEKTLRAFLASTQKLRLDYLDLYLIHWSLPARDTMLGTWQALEELYEGKKVRAIGVCNFRIEDLENLLTHCKIAPMVNQIELHPDFAQIEIRDFCEVHNIAVESWSPLGGNRSSNAILRDPVITKLAAKHGKTPAQIALRWQIQSGLIAIPKSVHAERIHENIDIFDFELSLGDMARIAELNNPKHRLGPDPGTMNRA